MSINSISNNASNNPQLVNENLKGVGANTNNRQNAQNSTHPVATDTVNLTGTASQLRSLEQQLASQPIVDAQRVDSIKREIANGSYEINSQQVADKMIQIESAINKRLI